MAWYNRLEKIASCIALILRRRVATVKPLQQSSANAELAAYRNSHHKLKLVIHPYFDSCPRLTSHQYLKYPKSVVKKEILREISFV